MAFKVSLALVPFALAVSGAFAKHHHKHHKHHHKHADEDEHGHHHEHADEHEKEAGSRPPCRKSPEFHSMTWPDGTDRVVAFGGKGYSWVETPHGTKAKVQMFGDTWGFDPIHRDWEELGHGHRNDVSPSSRWKPSSCTIDNDSSLVLFGGDHITNISGVLQDLWVFKTESGPGGGRWRQVYTHNTPRNRRGHILEASSTHLLIMGGKTYVPGSDGVVLTDLWTIPLAALKDDRNHYSWKQGAEFPGAPRWGATGTILKDDKGEEFMAVFGGRHLNEGGGFHSIAAGAYTYFNELWLYNFKNDSWSKPDIQGPAPLPRDHHAATSLNGDLWAFAGRNSEERSADAVYNDLWSFSLTTSSWTHHLAGDDDNGTAPIVRYMPGLTGTTLKGKPAIAVFGGETLPGSTKQTSMNDVWYYLPDGEDTGAWHEILKSDCSAETVAPGVLEHKHEKHEDLAEEQQASRSVAPAVVMVAAAFAVGATLAFRAEGQRRRLAAVDNDGEYYIVVE